MKINKLGEFGLIERIRRKFESGSGKGSVLGIGDDAAAIKVPGKSLLFTTDTLVEKVHFDLKHASFFDVGWKLLAANLSDIAAMGGTPKYALVTLGLNKSVKVEDVDEFYRGIKTLAKRFNVDIIGGDIVASPKNIFFTMDIHGEAKRAVRRDGAKAGHYIYSIGPLGESAIGLRILKSKKRLSGAKKFIKAHLLPYPLLKEGYKVQKYAASMIDNSDGLARCLMEICKSSKVGAEVQIEQIIPPKTAKAAVVLGIDPLKLVLYGGEDYGLLFTSRSARVKIPGVRLIGRIVKGKNIHLIDKNGVKRRLSGKGFEHF
ncbi:thiamine-phosphate kinase [Candidatus Margulisiibacteriota bacterium]